MRHIKYLVQRNIALFLNNRMNILLSFASIPIVISLYVFFLRDFLLGIVGQTGMDAFYVKEFTDRMMFAGLLVVINTTTCFGVLQICVNDSATGIKKDFLTAPISRFSLILGYWITSMVVSSSFTFLTALGGEVFFGYQYSRIVTLEIIIEVMFLILFSSCINSGILLCFAKNLKNTTTFSTFANLYGTVIGFLAGAYLPYYFYPDWLKRILLWFPPTQLTSLLRRSYVRGLQEITQGGQSSGFLKRLYQSFGIELSFGNKQLREPNQWSILIFSLAAILLYLWICCYEKGKKK